MSVSPQVVHAIASPSTPVYGDYGRKRYPAEIIIETEYGDVYVLSITTAIVMVVDR